MTTCFRSCATAILVLLAMPVFAASPDASPVPQLPPPTPPPAPATTSGSSAATSLASDTSSDIPPPPPPVTTGTPFVEAGITPSPYVPDGYVEVWGDEFNEKALDISKWWTRIIFNDGMLDHLNDEQQRYRENNNHVMTGTTLDLTARKVKDTNPQYESGMIRSKVIFKYAYFEIRVKVPGGKGCWPAFWMTSDANEKGHATWPPEMDPLEMAMNLKDDKANMNHIGAVVQKGKGGSNPTVGDRTWVADASIFRKGGFGGYYLAPFNFPDDYHVIGLLWQSDDTLTYYVDGVELMKGIYKWKTWDGKDAPYAHILCNLAIGGKWAGRYGVDDSAFPQAMSIDYIRVYQKPGHFLMGQGLVGHDLYTAPTQ